MIKEDKSKSKSKYSHSQKKFTDPCLYHSECYNRIVDSGIFIATLKKNRFDFITGVPCSYFRSLIEKLNQDPEFPHFPAVREDMAVGLSAGAYLSGRLPVVYMQNSGLGYSLEAFASLHVIYRIPTLVLMSYRGPEDPGMEEHRVFGEQTINILKSFQFNHSLLDSGFEHLKLDTIKNHILEQKAPYFLLIKKESLT